MKNRKIGYTYSSVSGHFAFRKEKSISQLNLATSIGHTSATFLGKAERAS